MKLNYESSSLVIVGGLNPYIMNPVWVEKYLLDQGGVEDGVDILTMCNFGKSSTVKYSTITISIKDIKLTFTDGRLEFNLFESQDFGILEKYALRICRCLPNTLADGYGVNLVFVEDGLNQDIAYIIRSPDLYKDSDYVHLISSEVYGCSIKFEESIDLNLNIQYNKPTNKTTCSFNFHFKIDNISELELGISKNSMYTLKEKAENILHNIYNLKPENRG